MTTVYQIDGLHHEGIKRRVNFVKATAKFYVFEYLDQKGMPFPRREQIDPTGKNKVFYTWEDARGEYLRRTVKRLNSCKATVVKLEAKVHRISKMKEPR
jgi:hypothetical protein